MTATTDAPTYLDAVIDLDSHEMAPVGFWGELFDQDVYEEIVRVDFRLLRDMGPENTLVRPEITGDVLPITDETVWTKKGPAAPSAIDFDRRGPVLDQMGVARQLVFPGFGFIGLLLVSDPLCHHFLQFDPSTVDAEVLGRRIVTAHNDWAARVTEASDGRVRPVVMILAESVDEMMREAERSLAQGARSFVLPANKPPADTSPADQALDPFWRLLAGADASVTLHVGTDGGVLSSVDWKANVPAFLPKQGIELAIEPYRAVTLHIGPENYLSTMVMGGVFERHPDLRFGVIELSAEWAGPLADRLDMWLERQFSRRLADVLSMRPSEYLARNVRVTPFVFEPVDEYIERYPHLSTMYCYSSDFPHSEGGAYSKRTFSEVLTDADETIREQFFVTNGEWLLPE